MITSLNGELIDRAPTHVVLECQGIGYLVGISLNTFSGLPAKGNVRLLVHYHVSVDVRSGSAEHKLYGFINEDERSLFKHLITVQGVSTTIAMALLSARSADELRRSIAMGDVTALKGVKGIGPKLAQRIVSSLADKHLESIGDGSSTGVVSKGNTLRSEALSALISLGLDRTKADRALQGVLKDRKEGSIELEELIRLTLKDL